MPIVNETGGFGKMVVCAEDEEDAIKKVAISLQVLGRPRAHIKQEARQVGDCEVRQARE